MSCSRAAWTMGLIDFWVVSDVWVSGTGLGLGAETLK